MCVERKQAGNISWKKTNQIGSTFDAAVVAH